MGDEGANLGTTTCGDFDVFLSFRGPDTRYTFTDCLYEYMTRTGIRTFRDEEELNPGKNISEILGAIKCSQIYIPIFSQGYASSQWCLRELTCMVECTRQFMGKEILPIFYDVDPSDVKLETDLYQSALRKHEVDNDCTLVKSWKEALTMVARTKGWRLKGQSKQGKLIADVTEKVLQKIAIRKRYLPTDLVGIDDHIEAIKQLLSCDTGGVRFVIIHGIGGIGKTTLAKAVFNQISPKFEGHSFLSNIRESSLSNGIVKMQRKLVADLFGFSLLDTFDHEEGSNMIRKRLPDKCVLLVLDDMDEIDQFVQQATNSYLYGPGSRIIITTRDFPMTSVEGLEGRILTQSTQILPYEMKEMHFDHALLLFNKLAFNRDSAPHELCDFSRQVVELTGGLPLALEVIGSHLRTISEATWKTTLKKLKVPLLKVQQRLRISYDALGCEGQQIFLDIACFFVNKRKTNAMYMWEACYFCPEVEIDVLIRKSLIKIDNDRILMHDQLRDLGRDIVRQESIKSLGDRRRLWFLETSQAEKGTENVATLTPRRSGHNFTREDFANLMNTRFLKLDGGNFAGNFAGILPELRWLCWQNCPPKLQANNFLLNHLVVLKLSGDITTEEWHGWVEIMVASKLKVLKIAGSESLIKTPCFSEFVSLERLVLKNLVRLAEIDHSIGDLRQLIHLKIKWCPRLKKLPEEIGCLTDLKELILIQGRNVCYLPHSIGNLRGLSRLVMEDTGLVELPDTIKGLVDLTHLYLVNCTNLNSLSEALVGLESLIELDLSGTTIGNLSRLILKPKDLTQLMRDLPMQGHAVRHLADLIGNPRDLRRPSMEDAGLVELQETISGLGDLKSLHLLNSMSLNLQSDAAGESRTLTELNLSVTTPREPSPSIWNPEVRTLRIHSWRIRRQLTRDLPIHEGRLSYLADSISNPRKWSIVAMETTGLIGHLDRRKGLEDLEGSSLLNRMSLNSLAGADGELKTFTELNCLHPPLIRRVESLLDIWNIWAELICKQNNEPDRELDGKLDLRSIEAELICERDCERVVWGAHLICKRHCKRQCDQNRRQKLRSFWAELECKRDFISLWSGGGSNLTSPLLMGFKVSELVEWCLERCKLLSALKAV